MPDASEIRTLAEKDSLLIHALELDVTTTPRSSGLWMPPSQSRPHRLPSTMPELPLGAEEAVTTEQARLLMDTNFLDRFA